jgi:hypothetical protein
MKTFDFQKKRYSISDEDINEGDFWIYVVPKEWEIKQEGEFKNGMPKEWFDNLWDRSNYKKVISIEELKECECCGKEFLQSELNEFNLCPKCEDEKNKWIQDMHDTYASDLRDV